MEALVEVTQWGTPTQNHIYLLDGDKLVAYIKRGDTHPFYFKNPISGFDRRGRKFKEAPLFVFPEVSPGEDLVEVLGSNGTSYFVDKISGRCTCPGYQFRGECKHSKKVALN